MQENIGLEENSHVLPPPKLNDVLAAIEDDVVFLPKQVAHLVGRSAKTVRRWCASGVIDAYSWGGRYVVYRVDVKSFMKKARNRKKHIKELYQ